MEEMEITMSGNVRMEINNKGASRQGREEKVRGRGRGERGERGRRERGERGRRERGERGKREGG